MSLRAEGMRRLSKERAVIEAARVLLVELEAQKIGERWQKRANLRQALKDLDEP